jgi:hypothetical protein
VTGARAFAAAALVGTVAGCGPQLRPEPGPLEAAGLSSHVVHGVRIGDELRYAAVPRACLPERPPPPGTLPPGCAVALAFDAQLNSRDDLRRPRPAGPSLAAPVAAAAQAYYEGRSRPAAPEDGGRTVFSASPGPGGLGTFGISGATAGTTVTPGVMVAGPTPTTAGATR